jgi:hypothetical protein
MQLPACSISCKSAYQQPRQTYCQANIVGAVLMITVDDEVGGGGGGDELVVVVVVLPAIIQGVCACNLGVSA